MAGTNTISDPALADRTSLEMEVKVLIKLPLLTCGFYVVLTVLLEGAIWLAAHLRGIGVLIPKDWFWTVGLKAGAVLGSLWIVAFSAAWWIVYVSYKAQFARLSQ